VSDASADAPARPRSSATRRTAVTGAFALAVAVVVTLLFARLVAGTRIGRAPDIRLQFLAKTFVSTFNVVVLLALTLSYLDLYREIQSRFTLSLIVFCLSLLLYAVTSMPVVPLLFGYPRGVLATIGPFAFLPDVFASFAALVLLHQSYE
jgi:hypothetical protein